MNKLFTKIATACVGLAMAVGVGVAVGSNNDVSEAKAAAGDTLKTFDSDVCVTNGGYATTYGDSDWSLNIGGNNISAGYNKNNVTAIPSAFLDGTVVANNSYGWVAKTKAGVANVGKMTFIYTGGSGNGTGKLALFSSSNGTSYSIVTLTSGTQGVAVGSTNSLTTFEFSTISESTYYAIVCFTSSNSGAFRFDNVTAKLIEGASSSALVTKEQVETLISAIGTVVYTSECKDKITAARAAAEQYNGQDGCAYADLSNYSVLTSAEETYAELEAAAEEAADRAAAAEVDELITNLGEITSYLQKESVDAARAAYNALSAKQKTYVENLDVLEAAEAAIAALAPTKYTISDYEAGVQYAESEEHVLDSIVTVVTNQAHFTSELRIYQNGSKITDGVYVEDNWVLIKSLKPINYFSANMCCNTSDQYTELTVYGSNNEGSNYATIDTLTSTAGKQYSDQTISTFGEDVSYSWIKIVNTGSYQCRVKSFSIIFEEVETTVSGVTVKGPNGETGTMTINSGVLGHKNIQLVSDVLYSEGQGDESVTWTSSNLKNPVNENGIVSINANEETVITVTSVEDPNVSPATLTLSVSGLTNPNLALKDFEVNTTNFGSDTIKATASDSTFEVEYNHINFAVDRKTCVSDPGYYATSPVSFRIYTASQLTISTVDGSPIHYINLLSLHAEYKLGSASATLSSGVFSIDADGNPEIDLSASPVSSVTLTSTAQFRFDKVKVFHEKTWANVILDSLTCSGVTELNPDGAITAADPTAIWAESEALFNSLSPEAKAALKTKAASEGGDFEAQALARYDLIVRKYGQSTYNDFIGRFSEGGANALFGRTISSQESNNTTAMIAIISIIGVTAIGGYFLLRKKKEQ